MAIEINISVDLDPPEPPSMETVKQVFREVYKKRGYIVIGTVPGGKRYEIDQVITQLFQYDVGAPFRVAQYTTAKDYKDQIDLISKLRPQWPRLTQARGGAYYRLVPLRKSPRVLPDSPKKLKAAGG